ncbi:metal-dependent hydrolase [Candidatus Parcubacteria bacterium]|nr:MAG: metal-dependent hydrolase [Candidatus Parcubacteria bacterium]
MLLDIGLGILAALGVANLFGEIPTELFIMAGIGFALLPDLDFVYALLRYGPNNYRAMIRHRDYLHYPILYVAAGGFLALFISPAWGVLFLITTLAHLAHDSIGLGWGVAWLWPLSDKNYTFFWRYVTPGKELPRQLVYCWERARIDDLIEEYRDPQWLKNIYFRPHPFFATEIIGFAASVLILVRVLG